MSTCKFLRLVKAGYHPVGRLAMGGAIWHHLCRGAVLRNLDSEVHGMGHCCILVSWSVAVPVLLVRGWLAGWCIMTHEKWYDFITIWRAR